MKQNENDRGSVGAPEAAGGLPKRTWFPQSPVVRAAVGDAWELAADHADARTGLVVRRGFLFDGASIPRWLWRVAGHPMQGGTLPAALEHDAEYSAQWRPREAVDDDFLRNMELLRVSWFKRRAFYRAVRLFGWISWRSRSSGVEAARKYVGPPADPGRK